MPPRVIGLVLALVTLLAFLPVTQNGFVNYDDDIYVTANPVVQKGLTVEGIAWAFSGWHISNWHPVTLLSHMMDCGLFRLNPAGHHLVNVLFHAANTVLLFVLMRRLMGADWSAAMVAALFGWHPLHVESVAWVAERKDVLSIFFGLLALLQYERYARAGGRFNYAWALLFFALSLMSKAMLVTLPLVLLLLDYWPLQRLQKETIFRLVREKLPYLALTGVFCIVTFLAQRSEAVVSLKKVSVGLRLGNAVDAYAGYLLKMAWPADLAVFYPLPKSIPWLELGLSAGLLAMISVAVGWFGRQRPYLWIGWLWYLITLLPVIGLVQVGDQAMADRYTYFPAIGIFLMLTLAAAEAAGKFHLSPKVSVAMAALVLLACLVKTEIQLRYWRDSQTLFTHALAVTRDNALVHLNLGAAYHEQNQPTRALAEYQAALKLDPGRREAYHNIGRILSDEGRYNEALEYCQAALQLDPHSPSAHDSLGIVLSQLGRFDEATTNFTEAIRLDPNYAPAYFQMGRTLLKQGRDVEAVAQFREAVRIDLDNFQMLIYVARVLAADENPAARDAATALEYARHAAALAAREQAAVFDTLAMAEAAAGNYSQAVSLADRAAHLAQSDGSKEDAVEILRRRELYQQNQAWRQSFQGK